MSRERLKEIKVLWEQNNDVCFPNDYEWLIEQAERVQELEADDYNMNVELEKLYEQNKRYREALEFYANPKTYYPQAQDGDYCSHITMDYGGKARKALEGEE